NAHIKAYRTDMHYLFGKGAGFDEKYWMALLRQVLVAGLLDKDIESYGVIKMNEKGEAFLTNPTSFMMTEDNEYGETDDETIVSVTKAQATADARLMEYLRDLRKKVAKNLGLPPFVIFQDPSLEDMALKYPIT